MSSEELDFGSLTPVQIPFKLASDDGQQRKFIIREASCEAISKYQDARMEASIYNEEGAFQGSKALVETIEPLLISLCIVETTGDGASAVSIEEIKRWPARVTNLLYSKIRSISELDKEDTEEDLLKQREEIEKKLKLIKEGSAAKNGQRDLPTTSS